MTALPCPEASKHARASAAEAAVRAQTPRSKKPWLDGSPLSALGALNMLIMSFPLFEKRRV